MDAESQQVEALKAENERLLTKHAKEQNVALSALERAIKEMERLRAALSDIDDHGRALSAMELFKAQQAEIERLTVSFQLRGGIIRELMDWMDSEFRLDTYPPDSPGRQLWDRAQDAIK